MDDLLDRLQLEDLQGQGRELADIIGLEAFKKLVEAYGGSARLYVPSKDSIVLPVRNELIRREYEEGAAIRQLAARWQLTERYIEQIVQPVAEALRKRPLEGQLNLFETA